MEARVEKLGPHWVVDSTVAPALTDVWLTVLLVVVGDVSHVHFPLGLVVMAFSFLNPKSPSHVRALAQKGGPLGVPSLRLGLSWPVVLISGTGKLLLVNGRGKRKRRTSRTRKR